MYIASGKPVLSSFWPRIHEHEESADTKCWGCRLKDPSKEFLGPKDARLELKIRTFLTKESPDKQIQRNYYGSAGCKTCFLKWHWILKYFPLWKKPRRRFLWVKNIVSNTPKLCVAVVPQIPMSGYLRINTYGCSDPFSTYRGEKWNITILNPWKTCTVHIMTVHDQGAIVMIWSWLNHLTR